MDTDLLRDYLDHPEAAAQWLRSIGIQDVTRGHANLLRLATSGITLDLLLVICRQLARELPRLSDPDMALNNLDRFVAAARSGLAIGSLFERDPAALTTLLQIASTSQYLSDLLVADPESYDLLRMTEGQPVAHADLMAELVSEVDALADDQAVMAALRRFKRRETLRIAYGDIVRGQSLATVTQQISFLADVIIEGAVRFSRRQLDAKRGPPHGPDGQRAQFVVLALGKLGGVELNYSSDVDLICFYDVPGRADRQYSHSDQEYFGRLVARIRRLLTEPTELGAAYRVDLRLRPCGSQGAAACSVDDGLRYYDMRGRTWERQAFIKARAVAGDVDLGVDFLGQLEPWIYRRYLSLADITGIKSLKRRIDERARHEGGERRDVKTGRGGIRDIEFVIQFLQLLNGGALPEIRTGNTLNAIQQLAKTGCLNRDERDALEEGYLFLRKIEHRLQIMFDLQTHRLPEDDAELRKVAIRMGCVDTPPGAALKKFRAEFQQKTDANRRILNHLLQTFADDTATEPEVDLVNHPDPPPERIDKVLGHYGFRDIPAAYRNLMALANEKIRFLSTRRCRHFLASIAPQLLRAIAATPDPDSTLVQLSQVSDSLGGKGALWELLNINRPSLDLYVRLCGACPYLASLLTSNPGMIDELMDSLMLDGLPTYEILDTALAELCHAAEDLDPILHSFKDAQHLRVGVRDILGKDDIQATHAALSATAEVCLKQIALAQYDKLVAKFGQPVTATGRPLDLAILALGKLGGGEPNYHSDLDLVFLYEEDGQTVATSRTRRGNTTTNSHFFSELGQKIIKVTGHLGVHGRLYEIDPRLRPTGGSGTLAVSLEEFARYFAEGSGRLWERQALCKGRVIHGEPELARRTMEAVARAAYGPPWQAADAAEIRQMRARLEATASRRNLKRGPGGTVDIEFLVQMLQLKHGGSSTSIRLPGTLAALHALHDDGLLGREDYDHFSRGYRFLRSVEARIRLMNAAGRHELPEDAMELRRLAYLLGYDKVESLVDDTWAVCQENRCRFERLFREAAESS